MEERLVGEAGDKEVGRNRGRESVGHGGLG